MVERMVIDLRGEVPLPRLDDLVGLADREASDVEVALVAAVLVLRLKDKCLGKVHH